MTTAENCINKIIDILGITNNFFIYALSSISLILEIYTLIEKRNVKITIDTIINKLLDELSKDVTLIYEKVAKLKT